MGSSRQEYWSGLPFPSPGNLPDSGIEPESPTLKADALTSEPPGKLKKNQNQKQKQKQKQKKTPQKHITSLQGLSCLYFEFSKDQKKRSNHYKWDTKFCPLLSFMI